MEALADVLNEALVASPKPEGRGKKDGKGGKGKKKGGHGKAQPLIKRGKLDIDSMLDASIAQRYRHEKDSSPVVENVGSVQGVGDTRALDVQYGVSCEAHMADTAAGHFVLRHIVDDDSARIALNHSCTLLFNGSAFLLSSSSSKSTQRSIIGRNRE